MLKSLHFLLMLLLASCAFLPTDKELLSSGNEITTSREELEARLTKISYAKGGDYEFRVYPISETMIKIDVDNISLTRGFSTAERNLFLKLKSQKYAFEKNCLNVNINHIGLTGDVELSGWNIFIIDPLGRKIPTEVSTETVRTYRTYFTGLYGKDMKNTSEGVACSRVKIDLSKGFEILITNGNELSSTISTTLSWRK